MKLQQLRYVLAVFRHENHMSAAAEALHVSQPGVSQQIQLLEDELGFEIFIRKRNRILGITEPGKHVISVAQRILSDAEGLRNYGEEIAAHGRGSLTIATTHTQARYMLPKKIEKFVALYPKVRLALLQANPVQVCELVESGDADIGIGSQTNRQFPNLVKLPCAQLPRSVIAKAGHPILRTKKRLTLQEIAKYPIITYDPSYSGRWKVLDAFQKADIKPNVVLGALDADVSKTYVDLGLGIAILASISFNASQDKGLRAKDASHLFEPSTIFVVMRRNSYLREFVYEFIKLLSPELTPDFVKGTLTESSESKSGR